MQTRTIKILLSVDDYPLTLLQAGIEGSQGLPHGWTELARRIGCSLAATL